jgi:NADH-quinone oxidoreductase subunit G
LYNSDDFILNKKNELYYIVYQGHHGDKGAFQSNLIFPSTFMLEKKGTYINMYGKFIKYRFVLKPSLNIRTDWRIFKAISSYLELVNVININSFLDLIYRCSEVLPLYKNGSREDLKGFLNFNNQVRIYNTLGYSFFINYYISDVVSRSSKVMSLAGVRFKNYYMNFLN